MRGGEGQLQRGQRGVGGQALAIHQRPQVIEHGIVGKRQQVLFGLPVDVIHDELPLIGGLLQQEGLGI
ncbi:hypothetical protein D3C79_925810 [compost metagenome]